MTTTTTTTSERDRDHARDAPSADAAHDHDDLTPGHRSRSALLRKRRDATASGLVQRAARDSNGVAPGAEDAVAAASSSSGSPLPDTLMRKFESSLGADLGGVRVHTGEASAAANDAVGAKAYTVGQDIHFGAGQYDPSSPAGEHLLAHEVAHTVQQAGGAARRQHKLAVSSPGDSLETEADAAADAMVQGAPATVSGAGGVSRAIQRVPQQLGGKYAGFDVKLVETSVGKAPVGPFEAETKILGAVSFKPAKADGDKAPETGGPEVKGGTDLTAVKAAAEKEFGPKMWKAQPKLAGEVELGKDGKPKVNIGIALEREGWDLGNKKFGPFSATATLFEWQPGEKAKFGTMAIEAGLSATIAKPFMGHNGSVAFKAVVDFKPDWVKIGQWLGQKAAGGAASSGTSGLVAALGAFGAPLLTTTVGAIAIIGLTEILDDLDGDKVAKEALLEVDRLSQGFAREMEQPGHQVKPSPFWKKDPYMRGIEMASQLKSAFFARFLGDPRVAKWRAANPDQGTQMQLLEAAYRAWVKKDPAAHEAIAVQAAMLKYNAKQATFSECFLAYANRWRFTSGATRVLRLFEQLWPGATWLDAGRTMPAIFSQSVPKACYEVVSSIAPVSYPKDLKRWVTPPTLI